MRARETARACALAALCASAASASSSAAAAAAWPSLAGYQPPQAGLSTGGDLGPSTPVADAPACAAACSARSDCISFSVGSAAGLTPCGVAGECYASNATSCPSVLALGCPGGLFSAVAFASFGAPRVLPGACAYARNASCDAAASAAVLAAACVGRAVCAVEVGAATFGGDPCPGVYKFLAVAMAGNCSDAPPPPAQPLACTLAGYSRTYAVVNLTGAPNASFAYYQRLQPRDDRPFTQAVPYALSPPTAGVMLNGGVLGAASDAAVHYLTSVYTVDDLLFNFRKRAGLPQPPGAHCQGWDCTADWIEGSPAGLFLMGAGGHLRWREIPALRTMMDALIDGIENCTEADGWLSAYTQAKMATDEHPDYTTSWTTHGFLEAAIAGNTKALRMIRAHMNVFNNHTLIPTFLPPDGGNWPWQVPAGPWPPGADNKTASGSGTLTGHTIYLIVQGIIHSTRLALSPVGTHADVDLVRNLYGEPWWLDSLAAKDYNTIGHKLFFSHNYQLTGIEAYCDMYILTGDQRYYDAVMGAWEMHRDPVRGWILLGGSLAINEGDIYEPGSFHLEAGTNGAAVGGDDIMPREAARARRGAMLDVDGAGAHGRAHRHAHGHSHGHDNSLAPGDGSGWSGKFPTGEFCGAVFWLKLNQRLHRLFPDNETFVLEIEREVFNEGLAHLAPDGSGIRYFSYLNGQKQEPGAISTCCEGQGTRLYGSLQEYLYATTPAGAIYIDVYAPSTFSTTIAGAVAANITTFTSFPYGDAVDIDVTLAAAGSFDLALRMPAWLAAPSVPVTVGGSLWPTNGAPGTYLHITRAWNAGTTRVSFALPQAVVAHIYTGVTQLPPYTRYGFTYGPTLLAARGGFNSSLKSIFIDRDGSQPEAWMVPAADGLPLHFDVDGTPGVTFVPAWEVQQELFSAFPCFSA